MPVIVLPAGGPGRPPGSAPKTPAWPRLAAVTRGSQVQRGAFLELVGITKRAAGAALSSARIRRLDQSIVNSDVCGFR